jgi:hypothetical protein
VRWCAQGVFVPVRRLEGGVGEAGGVLGAAVFEQVGGARATTTTTAATRLGDDDDDENRGAPPPPAAAAARSPQPQRRRAGELIAEIGELRCLSTDFARTATRGHRPGRRR